MAVGPTTRAARLCGASRPALPRCYKPGATRRGARACLSPRSWFIRSSTPTHRPSLGSALKGADAAVAGVLTTAAQQARCDLHLALLTVEESGAAEYSESYGSRWGRWGAEEDEFEAGEVFDCISLPNWQRPDGSASTLGDIPVEAEEFSPPDACDDLAPDEEHFHEATGNEGVLRAYLPAGSAGALAKRADLCRPEPGWATSDAALSRRPDPRWATARGIGTSSGARRMTSPDICSRNGRRRAGIRARTRPQRRHPDAHPADGAGRHGADRALPDRSHRAGRYDKGDNAAILAALDRLPPRRATALIERIVAGTATTALEASADLLAWAAAAWGPGRATLAGAAPAG